jgi:preprotein translocase subunit SecD
VWTIQPLCGGRLVVKLVEVTDPNRAKSLIGETAHLEFKRRTRNVLVDLDEFTQQDIVNVEAGYLSGLSTELSPGRSPGPTTSATSTASSPATSTGAVSGRDDDDPVVILIEFTEDAAVRFEAVLDRLMESFAAAEKRLDDLGVPPEFAVGLRSYSRLDVTVEGVEQLRFEATILSIMPLGSPTTFAFALPLVPDSEEPQDLAEVQRQVGEDAKVFFTENLPFSDEYIGLTGDDLARAFPSQHTASGAPVVNIEFNHRGTRIFAELTVDIVQKQQRTGEHDQIAIFLDDEELTASVVQTAITDGTAIIHGRDFTMERVIDLALLLEVGRLPVSIKLIQERDLDFVSGDC